MTADRVLFCRPPCNGAPKTSIFESSGKLNNSILGQTMYFYKFMVTKFPYRVYSWPRSRRKRLSETMTNSPPCHRNFGAMTSSYKYTTFCVCIAH